MNKRAAEIQAQIQTALDDLKIVNEPDERRKILRNLRLLIDRLGKAVSGR